MAEPRGWAELSILLPQAHEEGATALLSELFPAGLQVEPAGVGRIRLIGYTAVPEGGGEAGRCRQVATALEPIAPLAVSYRWIEDRDWLALWREEWQPVRLCPGIWVRAPWHEKPAEGRSICLEPGMAFGTGHHESTRLVAGFLAARVGPGGRYLDLGCGTAVLAMAALLLGATHVDLFDIDPTAREVALREIECNSWAHAGHWLEFPDEAPRAAYEGVFINITVDVICRLLPQVLPCLKPGAWIAVSGILQEQAPAFLASAQALGLRPLSIATEGEWWGALIAQS